LVSPGPVSSVMPSSRHFPAAGTQLPVVGLHEKPAAQSSVVLHWSRQAAAPHANGAHDTLSLTQAPLPSHSATDAVSPLQLGVPQA
jgi:hypothetical protein